MAISESQVQELLKSTIDPTTGKVHVAWLENRSGGGLRATLSLMRSGDGGR